MPGVLLNIRWPGPAPDAAAVQSRYGIESSEMDPQFGVICIDPDDHLYTILVTPEAAARVSAAWANQPEAEIQGPFSNPAIEPFGPPEH